MGLIDKIIIDTLFAGDALGTVLDKLSELDYKRLQKYERKMYKKYPDSHFIWSTFEIESNLEYNEKAKISFLDSNGREKYNATVKASKNSVNAKIYDNEGKVIWEIKEQAPKSKILKKYKTAPAKDLDVFQYERIIGTVRTLREDNAFLFFDFLDWVVYKEKDSFKTRAHDGTIVCENFFSFFNTNIGCIVYKINNIEEVLLLVNTAIIMNLLAREREEKKQRKIDEKREYKELKKALRKSGDG